MGDGVAGGGKRMEGLEVQKISPELIALATVVASLGRTFHPDIRSWKQWSEGERAFNAKRALLFAERLAALGFTVAPLDDGR